jgi:hypothetical protein
MYIWVFEAFFIVVINVSKIYRYILGELFHDGNGGYFFFPEFRLMLYPLCPNLLVILALGTEFKEN